MKIEEYLSTEEFKTKQELMQATGLCDREVRNQISILKKKRAVIYNSQTRRIQISKRYRQLIYSRRSTRRNRLNTT